MVSMVKFSGRSVPRRFAWVKRVEAFSLGIVKPSARLFKMVLRGCWKRIPTVS